MINFMKSVNKTNMCVYLFLLSLNVHKTDPDSLRRRCIDNDLKRVTSTKMHEMAPHGHSTSGRHYVSHLSSTKSKMKVYKNLINYCEISEFQCDNGKCIDESLVCDGIRDCLDGSDETHNICQNIRCNENFFKCDYGGCILKDYVCDGLKQCFDGSDESTQICNATNQNQDIRNKRAANDLCPVPPQSADKTITYQCSDGSDVQYCYTNGYVREFTVATITCNPNYSLLENTPLKSICHNKKWIAPIENCYRTCDQLNPVNVDLQCYRKGVNIDCDSTLLSGTAVRPTCKPLHTYKDFVPTYHEISCQEDGKWDANLFSCVPECGRPYTNPTALISGGVEERFGDSPWHVAVYNQDKVLICGGTIINPYLVVSAAHCFHDQANNRKDSSNYEIVVSKYTRDYNVIDNTNQRAFRLREIRYSNKGYIGINNYFAADIAILILEEKLTISPTVLPACVDWAGLRTNRYPPENTPAKVVGWGKNEHGKLSERLMTVDLPFISRQRCLNNVPNEFKAFITFDKFCAGSEDGPGVLQGDSGGGLLFRENNLYYLRGIVSLKQPTSTAVAAFTDLADHIDWILSVRNEIEREMINKDSTLPQRRPSIENTCKNYAGYACAKIQDCSTANHIIANSRAEVCGYDSNQNPDRICCPQRDVVQNLTPNQVTPQNRIPPTTAPPYNTPPSIATAPPYKPPPQTRPRPQYNTPAAAGSGSQGSQYNTRPPVNSKPQYNTPPSVGTGPQYNVPNAPSSGNDGTASQPGEYPHTAIIGYGNDNSIEWACDGALISERFVISAAHCGNTPAWGEPRWVMLGVVSIFTMSDKARPAIYSIVRRYDHPNYKPSAFYNDVTVFLLNTSVTITPYIRPACLYTSTFNPVNTKASITGWGTAGPVQQRGSQLQKSTITVMDDEKCRMSYQSGTQQLEQGYDSNTMVCAGDTNEGNKLCAALAGSPLQIPTKDQTACPWTIVGIKSFGTSCGNTENAHPDVFSKVSYHLDWIQRLVNWPL